MDTQRLILFFIFSFSLLLLWDAWEKENRPKPPPAPPAAQGPAGVPAPAKPAPAPGAPAARTGAGTQGVPAVAPAGTKSETVRVQTDLVAAEIDTLGGTLRRLELLRHKATEDEAKNFVLFSDARRYEAQSGLAGDLGANHRSVWTVQAGERSLADGRDAIEVRLTTQANGLSVAKVYTFRRNSYVIDVALEVRNEGTAAVAPFAYFQLTHDGEQGKGVSSIADSFGAQSFFGYAVYSDEKKFQKIPLAEVEKGKADYLKQAQTGWLGFIQHYFVSAWLPAAKQAREYAVERRADPAAPDRSIYAGRVILPFPSIAPGGSARVAVPLYAGPQEQRRLKEAAAGLDLAVDYGWLTIIAWPLFWVLELFHGWSGNWGVAIILLTILIKLVFFPLSAASYKSMAKMKLITPRLTKIREMYGHDREKMNKAMMELYKTEKINPLGGCFPIVVQIPVFIALYWVLLAAIELRHAPFIFWIKDLSALDPYYVLPLLMTATMILQTRMNPVPPDPVQAQVMKFMPYV
ncbi:MAG: membrane protein insertase YidC, partial [Betaproteobacteria bacterium]|nr:membrane protein insertase YidC [Betaproteobacteria bacterium]